MLRFCSLASGSSGNATLVEASSGTTRTRVLIDAGLGDETRFLLSCDRRDVGQTMLSRIIGNKKERVLTGPLFINRSRI